MNQRGTSLLEMVLSSLLGAFAIAAAVVWAGQSSKGLRSMNAAMDGQSVFHRLVQDARTPAILRRAIDEIPELRSCLRGPEPCDSAPTYPAELRNAAGKLLAGKTLSPAKYTEAGILCEGGECAWEARATIRAICPPPLQTCTLAHSFSVSLELRPTGTVSAKGLPPPTYTLGAAPERGLLPTPVVVSRSELLPRTTGLDCSVGQRTGMEDEKFTLIGGTLEAFADASDRFEAGPRYLRSKCAPGYALLGCTLTNGIGLGLSNFWGGYRAGGMPCPAGSTQVGWGFDTWCMQPAWDEDLRYDPVDGCYVDADEIRLRTRITITCCKQE